MAEEQELPEYVHFAAEALSPFLPSEAIILERLVRPKFRYLHYIITGVFHATGFAEGLYDDAEMDAKSYGSKEDKMRFFAKAIAIVTLTLQKQMPTKPRNIVSGQDADKTSDFLVYLVDAASSGKDVTPFVAKIREKTDPKPQEDPEPSAPVAHRDPSPEPEREIDPSPEPEREIEPEPSVEYRDPSPEPEEPAVYMPEPNIGERPVSHAAESPMAPTPTNEEIERPTTRLTGEDIQSRSRRGPPRSRASSTRSVASAKPEQVRKMSIVVESEGESEEEVVDFDEFAPEEEGNVEVRGKLTSDLVAEKKRLSARRDSGRLSSRKSLQLDEIESLKDQIQLWCQKTIPITRNLDFVMENVGDMMTEFKNYLDLIDQLEGQLMESEDALEINLMPIKNQILIKEQRITDLKKKTTTLKGLLYESENTINQLVMSTVSNSEYN
ncbi:hypothetical protein PCE1_002973 [Barthelona sp. PCE]